MIPCPIAEDAMHSIPDYVIQQIHQLDHFIVERAKTARQYIKACQHPIPLQELMIEEMDKHDDLYAMEVLKSWTKAGKNIGIISEAGCPGIADPGADLVAYAQRNNIPVIPLVGPSSILLALMASGFNGQNFSFHGYLPNKNPALSKAIQALERKVQQKHSAEICIETPYRNKRLFDSLLQHCSNNTRLCIAADLTGQNEYVKTQTINNWKKSGFPLKDKIPAIFILGK